jgi:hypothetical protein
VNYQKVKRRKYYKLRGEWKQLKQEHNDLELVFSKISIQFVKGIRSFCSQNDLGDPFAEINESTQNVGGATFTSSSKAVFRQIVLSTHPDKVKNKEKAQEVYDAATKARKSGNLQELIDAGKNVSIKLDLEKITTEDLNLLEDNINDLKDKIIKITNSYAWVWFHASPIKRNEIFFEFIESHAK